MNQVIDVSKYQGKIDWVKVRAAGVTRVVIRLGYRGYKYGNNTLDTYFRRNISGALAAGLMVDIYYLSQAITEAEAVQEVDFCVAQLVAAGWQSRVRRIIIDSEAANVAHTGRADGLSKSARTAITVAFCDRVAALGYTPGVYASYSWYLHNLDFARVAKWYVWVARYGASKPGLTCDMWQYSSNGRVDGIAGRVDVNHDYSSKSVATPNLGTATLRKKSRGVYVYALQAMLGALGYSCGKSDGIFGAKTRAAVIAYQTAANIKADGIVGPQTRAALYASYAAKEAA